MTNVIRIHENGGPEVMKWESADVRSPDSGQVRIRQTAVGLNFIDCYHRSGLYPLPSLPAIIGTEASGVIQEIGADVTGLSVGQRVAYAPMLGAYAEERLIPAAKLIAIPEAVTDEQAASMMLQGITGHGFSSNGRMQFKLAIQSSSMLPLGVLGPLFANGPNI
jgi:NADPH2:quinone reductase